MMKCEWIRAFDGHFNIGCVGENGQRANGHFKPDTECVETKWNFNFCPYCGKEIEVKKVEGEDE